jgi:uncharacterized RDD family membrane protein YckC
MKCPKCGYLGFERVERCKNCGYDFSLTHGQRVPELSIRLPEADDVTLPELPLSVPASSPAKPSVLDLEQLAETLEPAVLLESAPSELPLFAPSSANTAPMLGKPTSLRPPLAVRRAPEVVKPRGATEPPSAPLLDLVPEPTSASAPRAQSARAGRGDAGARGVSQEAAGMIARSAAGLIDLLILGAVDGAVIYFTIRICGLQPGELAILPKAPLITFFLVQNGAYLVAFNAGGQTLGKMATGIKVVAAKTGATVDLGRSLLRTFVWALLAAPAGLGFLTAFFSSDGRGLHDRCAGTRVVRTGAA